MYYKGLDKKVTGIQLSESVTFKKIKISHLLIGLIGNYPIIDDAGKITIDVNTTGGGVPSRQLITRVGLLTLCRYTQRMGSLGLDKSDETFMYSLVPIGSMNLDDMDLNVEINSSSTMYYSPSQNISLRFFCYGVRISDTNPVLEFQERDIITQGKVFNNVIALFDIDSAPDNPKVTKITFDNSSQISINHDIANIFTNASDQIFSQVEWSTLFLDKDMRTGRNIKVEPDDEFRALIVHYSILNGMMAR